MVARQPFCRIIALTGAILISTQTQTVHSAQAVEPSSRPVEQVVRPGATPEQLVALDLVGTLMQIEQLSPNVVSFSMQPAVDPFGANLRQTLEMAGYIIAPVSDEPSASINYSISEKESDGGIVRTYQINAGSVKVRRDYLVSGKSIKPSSTIYLRGADASGIYLNDEIFNLENTSPLAGSQTVNSEPDFSNEMPEIFLSTIDQEITYQLNDPIIVSVVSNSTARMYCYYQDGHGQIAKIYPNRFNTDNLVTPNQKIMIPGTDEWNISATRVGASDDFLCVATDPSNSTVIAVLDEDPDLEPLAARSLDQIQQGLSASSDMPILFKKLSLSVK